MTLIVKTYEDLFEEYKYTKPSFLYNGYAKKIKKFEFTADDVKGELVMLTESTARNSKKLGGEMRRVKKGT